MKKTYFAPEADIVEIELQSMIAETGGDPNSRTGDGDDDPDKAGLNQAPARYNVWDE